MSVTARHLATAALFALASRLQAQSDSSSSAAKLFQSLRGKWSCDGGFPNGRRLSADLTFDTAVDGRAITFEHVDRAPGSYWQRSTWALESKTNHIISMALVGSTKNRAGSPSMFTAHAWSQTSITLDADTLKAPPFAPNRFTYSLPDPNSLKMVWELSRNGTWAVGDSLLCTRKP